jgi:putative oxidoreductase
MANSDSFSAKWGPRLLSVLRIIAGFLFMQHGAQKLFGVLVPPTPPNCVPQSHGTIELLSLPGIAGMLEFGGGILLILGLFTRPVAFILSGLMAVAYFMVHAKGGFWPIVNGGEPAALYSFLFLYLAVAGGGEWSLDRLVRRDQPLYYR